MGRQKQGYIGGRIGFSLRSRLDEIVRRHGISDTRMLEDALTALADYVEVENAYRRPVRMVFDAESDQLQRQLAAEATPGAAPQVAAAVATHQLHKQAQASAGQPNKPPAAHK